jgi:hypothetical protein
VASDQLEYRIWQDGPVWRWEVKSAAQDVLGVGACPTSVEARAEALNFALARQDELDENNKNN